MFGNCLFLGYEKALAAGERHKERFQAMVITLQSFKSAQLVPPLPTEIILLLEKIISVLPREKHGYLKKIKKKKKTWICGMPACA